MNIADITEALEAIKSLPISRLNERQGMLVALLAEMVNSETSDGEGTELNECLEGQDWWQTLDCLTRDAGFKRLGNGHFSAAYSHPLLPNRVIKVGFKKEDSGAAYVAFCRMHQGRLGIPNIYDVQRHAGCYTVVLDKLYDCDDCGNDTHFKYITFARDIIEHNSREYDEGYTGWDSEFIATCKLIREFFNGIASFDMHTGNIMFTLDDVPYITDPVSFSKKKDNTSFSLEPNELLQEIEELAAQAKIDKAIARHERKEKRLDAVRGRRKARKDIKKRRKKRTANLLQGKLQVKQHFRNEDNAKLLMGAVYWQQARLKARLKASCGAFADLEAVKAAQKVNHDHLAIQAGQPLLIDKKLDAMFMG